MNKKQSRRQVAQLTLMQCALTLLLSGLGLIIFGLNAASSALLGGIVCIIPNTCFAWILFQHQGAQASKRIVNAFYKGEAFKIMASIFLFTVVFVLCRITPLVFFATYILVQMTHWFAPLVMINNKK